MRLDDLGYDDGCPAHLAEWLVAIDTLVEAAEAKRMARMFGRKES